MSTSQTEPRRPSASAGPQGATDRPARPSLIDGPPVQVLDIVTKGRTDIIRQARLDGMEERPLTSDTEPNNDEKHYIDQYRLQHSTLGVEVNSVVEAKDQEFAELEKLPTPTDVDNLLDATHARIHDERVSLKSVLEHDEETLQYLEREMEDFRRDNQLTHRSAERPLSSKRHFAIIAAIVLVESVLNANFFAQANSSGLLGGWMEAMFVSFMNVGVAVAVGIFVLRELWHVKVWRKVAAGLFMLGYTAFVAFFNLVTAHYRDLLERGNEFARVQALPDAVHSPFSISFSSLMLFVVGIVWACLGLREGLASDDVYPGFGKLTKRLSEARLHSAAARDALWRRTKLILDGFNATCTSLKAKSQSAIGRMQEIESEVEILEQRYDAKRKEIQDTFERGLRRYREENLNFRNTPPPVYFKSYEQFSDEFDHDIPRTFPDRRVASERDLERLEAAVDVMASKHNQRQEAARAAHEAFLGEVKASVLQRMPVRESASR